MTSEKNSTHHLNEVICEAFGIKELHTIQKVRIDLLPGQPPEITITRIVTEHGGFPELQTRMDAYKLTPKP